MCGIVGYVGSRPLVPLLVGGLKRLEYRGYDSAGIATLVNGKIERRRAEGKLANLAERLDAQPLAGTIGIGHMLECTAFSMVVMISRLEGFDKNLEEASLDLGENAWSTFRRVTFPLAIPGLIASLLLTFTISFDEFILAFFLAGNEATLPIYIWSQLRFPTKLPSVLALGACILGVSFIVVTFAEWVRRRGVKGIQVRAVSEVPR